MTRLCFFSLANVVLVVGRMKPEPLENNFFLVNIPLNSGHQSSVVFFTNSSSKKPEPLCLSDDDPKSPNFSLLAHKLCTDSKFTTFSQTFLVEPSLVLDYSSESSSALSCHQDEYYEIVCNRSTSSPGPCSLLQVTCGACHSFVNLQLNSSLQLMSPLYPVLQPGLVCQYDLQLPHDISADISIEIADLSLAPAESSHSGKHCVNSFLHILSGGTFSELESVATLCGEVYYPGESSLFKVKSSVRLMLVSGSANRIMGRRGFLANVHVSSSRVKIPIYILALLLSFFGFLILIGVVLSSVILYLNRKSKIRLSHPRRRQTWHGSVARPGESLHQTRTERIRQLGRRSRTSWGSDNLYMFDNRVSRRLPQLPSFNFASEDHQQDIEADDPGFKVYETLSLRSRSSKHNKDESNPEKKLLTSSNQCPPPLPLRPTPIREDPYSPIYLTLPGFYSDTLSQTGASGDTPSTPAVNEPAQGNGQVTECPAESNTNVGRQKGCKEWAVSHYGQNQESFSSRV